MKPRYSSFIIIDDDPINNRICEKIIQKVIPDAEVITFTEPHAGFEYVKSTRQKPTIGKAILLLDINMPTMTGWEFMEQFEQLDTTLKERFLIYILSSSVNPADIEKAKSNKKIIDYIEKPLSASLVQSLL
jgi:CheY-like chemotaxis protein